MSNPITWDEAQYIEYCNLFNTIASMSYPEVTAEQWHRLYVLDGNLHEDCHESFEDFKDRHYDMICEHQAQERFEAELSDGYSENDFINDPEPRHANDFESEMEQNGLSEADLL